MERNYWKPDGEGLRFESDELAFRAELPRGWTSLKILGHEFLRPGDAYGAITFRKPDGSYVRHYVDADQTSPDSLHGRIGSVSDGLYLSKVITGWTLPDFGLYAGFNEPTSHDLVIFLHDDVTAVRVVREGVAASTARQNYRHGGKPGGARGPGAVIVHQSGVAFRIHHDLWAGILTAPDGVDRLAVAIPCRGLVANDIACRIDTHNATDNLLVWPEFDVESPTRGQGDPGYLPSSCGGWALYEKGAPLDYIVRFGWLGRTPFKGKVVVRARHALGSPHLDLEAVPELVGEQAEMLCYRAVLHPAFSLPGVSDVDVYLLDSKDVVPWASGLRVLYDWPAYRPGVRSPPDLKAFWDQTLFELRSSPLDARVEKSLFKDDPAWEFTHISYNGWRNQRIHACLYAPKAAREPLPVMVTSHPGTLGFGGNTRADGVYGSKVKQDPRFVTIVPLVRGHEPDAANVPFNQPWWGPLDSRDAYAARSWFCAMVRAIDYLATRPDLADMSRIVASGGSQGGALALATAALDRRVTLCLADSPSNCMHQDAVRPGTYRSFGPTSGQVPAGQTLDDLLRMLSYYDPAVMAPWITCPTVIGVTVGDLTVHSMGGLGVFKNLTALRDDQKWFLPGVNGSLHVGSAAAGILSRTLLEKMAGPLPAEPPLAGMEGRGDPK